MATRCQIAVQHLQPIIALPHIGRQKATGGAYDTGRRRVQNNHGLRKGHQFCAEANIEHKGRMFLPPSYHKEMP